MAKAPKWTKAEMETAAAMRLEGKTSAEIGAALGRSAGAVQVRLHHMGVKMPPEKAAALYRRCCEAARNSANYGEQRRAKLKASYTQERRQAAGELARSLRIWEKGIATRTTESRRASQKIATAAFSKTRTGWCPAHLLPEYRRLVAHSIVPAAEARRMLEDEWAAQLRRALRQIAAVAPQAIAEAKRQAEAERAYRRSFAGQIERVQAGAALVPALRLSRGVSADRSLTGNAEALL